MKPQIRPFSTITSEAIWHSAKHWVLLTPWVPKIIWSPCRTLASIQECAYARRPSLQAYPCTYSHETGEITSIPWPVLPGEELIWKWESEPCSREVVLYPHLNVWGWTGSTCDIKVRPGLHPAPRRQINPDGTVTPVWVWEADR